MLRDKSEVAMLGDQYGPAGRHWDPKLSCRRTYLRFIEQLRTIGLVRFVSPWGTQKSPNSKCTLIRSVHHHAEDDMPIHSAHLTHAHCSEFQVAVCSLMAVNVAQTGGVQGNGLFTTADLVEGIS